MRTHPHRSTVSHVLLIGNREFVIPPATVVYVPDALTEHPDFISHVRRGRLVPCAAEPTVPQAKVSVPEPAPEPLVRRRRKTRLHSGTDTPNAD